MVLENVSVLKMSRKAINAEVFMAIRKDRHQSVFLEIGKRKRKNFGKHVQQVFKDSSL